MFMKQTHPAAPFLHSAGEGARRTCLDRPNIYSPVFAKNIRHGCSLDRVSAGGSCGMALEKRRLANLMIQFALTIAGTDQRLVRLGAGHRDPGGPAVAARRRRPDDSPDEIPVADRVVESFHQDHMGGLASGIAARARVEGPRGRMIAEHSRVVNHLGC